MHNPGPFNPFDLKLYRDLGYLIIFQIGENTIPKLTMEPKNGVLEDDFLVPLDDFVGSMLIFPGVYRIP